MAASNLYVQVKITWVFETSPTNYLFYSDPNCDSFNMGRFSDSFTDFVCVKIVGNASLTYAKLKTEIMEKYRDRMAVVEMQTISRREYTAAIERLHEECAA